MQYRFFTNRPKQYGASLANLTAHTHVFSGFEHALLIAPKERKCDYTSMLEISYEVDPTF